MVMQTSSDLDLFLGLEVYGTTTRGIGGVIRKRLEDFIVEEIPLQGGSTGNLALLIIEKRGIDTLTAAVKLAEKLKIPLKHVGFAGLKDTRSISRQRFTVKIPEGVDPFSLSNRNMKILAVYRAKKHLRPGMLLGNKFSITIRDLEVPLSEAEELVQNTLSQIAEIGGVPNFYGYQRFGINRPNTHIIGKYIIQGKYEEAVMELLASPYPNEPQSHREAREFLAETMDFKKALKVFPKSLIFERQVIKWLIKNPQDYVGALKSLPKYVLTLYVDAYLAYVFNKALSERLRKVGSLKIVLEGDIIARSDAYGNPLRPTYIAKLDNIELKDDEMILAFIPACSVTKARGFMNDLIISLFRKDGIEPPLKRLEEIGLQGRLGLVRQLAFKPLDLMYQVNRSDNSVELHFSLPKSSYATMLLREVMKPKDPIASGY